MNTMLRTFTLVVLLIVGLLVLRPVISSPSQDTLNRPATEVLVNQTEFCTDEKTYQDSVDECTKTTDLSGLKVYHVAGATTIAAGLLLSIILFVKGWKSFSWLKWRLG